MHWHCPSRDLLRDYEPLDGPFSSSNDNNRPGGGSLAEELHEAALHHEPEASGHVEDDGEEDEVKRHPLVVRVIHDCVVTVVLKQQKN